MFLNLIQRFHWHLLKTFFKPEVKVIHLRIIFSFDIFYPDIVQVKLSYFNLQQEAEECVVRGYSGGVEKQMQRPRRAVF